MKKIASSLLMSILLTVLIAGCGKQVSTSVPVTSPSAAAAKGALDKLKEKGVLVIGSSNDTPFAFIDKDTKKFVGIDAEICQELAKRLGIAKVEMKETKFENLLLELNNKNVDMVADGMYVKPEREKIASFTTPWYKEGEGLIVLKDSPIKGVDDLKDKVIGGQKGTAFLEYVQQLKDQGKIKDIKIFGSQSELILATNTKKIDAAITDSATAAYTLANDASLSVKLVSPYTAHYSGIVAAAVRQEDKDLLDAVNKELANLKKEGFILKVLKKYGLNEDNFVQ